MQSQRENSRRLSPSISQFHPRYVVWELTLNCDQRCHHCGSRASSARPEELSVAEALQVVRNLEAMGTKDVVLIGGEAYLYEGYLQIIEALATAGIRVSMVSGGRNLNLQMAKDMRQAGLDMISLSIDGLEKNHDLIRANRGSFMRAMRSLDNAYVADLKTASNININKINCGDLEELYELLKAKAIVSWQVQLTSPLGRAADRPDMLLQPFELLEIFPRVANLKQRAQSDGITLMPGNNLGYFGPEETLLRSLYPGDKDYFLGCQAGQFLMGIESDGSIKGCPSLQSDSYVGGNVKSQDLASIWEQSPELGRFRNRGREDLWGFCRTCVFADTCKGGCSFTAHAFFGKPGNNPYCHFRARSLAKEGKRERIRLKQPAPGVPFDHGIFEIVLEDCPVDQGESLPPTGALSHRQRLQTRGLVE